ncbi:MAG: hypothetical protein H7Y33_11210 [Cytophagales bacterium]|nr:hypothetical protein [Rhizobacter sp.]
MGMRIARMQLRAPRPFAAAPPRHAAAATVDVAARPDATQAAARRRLVNVVLVIYLLAILEGALRKYVAPQFGQYIFFIRDPFVLYVYVLATRFALWPPRGAFFQLSIVMGFLGVALFVAHFLFGGYSEPRLLLGIHGWRSYFLYVPLAFLVGAQFSAADLARFSKITLLLAVPIAILVVAQFSSPINAPINVGVAEEKELQFVGMVLDVDHVRTTGPFTSPAGLQQFTVTACAFLLASLLLPARRRPLGLVPTLAAGASVLTCVALSGSRGTLLQCVLTAVFAVLIGAIGRGTDLKAKALALPTSLAALAVVLYPIVFPAGFAVFVNRWNGAAVNEKHIEGGLIGRTWYTFIDFVHLLDGTPILGYGLGYGSNASIQMRATVDGVRPGAFVEADFARHMVDLGPVFGLCYIVFRIALLIWLLRMVLRATRSAPDPLPMLLFAYTGYTVLIGQITGNGSINVYGWLFVGLCIAASRVALEGAQQADSEEAHTGAHE